MKNYFMAVLLLALVVAGWRAIEPAAIAAQQPATKAHMNMLQLMRAFPFPHANVLFDTQGRDPVGPEKKDSMVFSVYRWGDSDTYAGWEGVENSALALVEMAPILLPQLLDEGAGNLFLKAVRDEGVTVRTGSLVSAVAQKNSGIEVTLKSGDTFTVDMAVVATGVRPYVDFLRNGTISLNKGVLVNEYMQTNHPDIYVAGDVAETKATRATERGRSKGYPLLFTTEPEE